jgi:hypothetical protein
MAQMLRGKTIKTVEMGDPQRNAAIMAAFLMSMLNLIMH